MNYRGDFAPAQTIYFRFTTTDDTGAPISLDDTPAVVVYRDDGAGQSVAGVTLTVDFDGVVGLNAVVIDLAADDAFYAAGHDFDVVIGTGTAGEYGTSVVGYVVGGFSIANRLLSAPQLEELPAVPTHLASIVDMVRLLFLLSRNKLTQSSTTQTVRDNADGADVATAPVSDAAGVTTRGKYT